MIGADSIVEFTNCPLVVLRTQSRGLHKFVTVVSTQSTCLSTLKLQAILSRGRTWDSRPISGEKVDVLMKEADPTEDQQQKKSFRQFRCQWSRASQIEGDLH
ncbi:hypothetical protein Taro_026700 [Colocasia esculenta]|uniref:Uncharacterized protein n=1 Tax=Colocasia esculenta TaxID=4460 RepID=A0A843VC31_COLES|nr:hypothetical protein [Colocasia esculenta]